jgi:hypothetical protein
MPAVARRPSNPIRPTDRVPPWHQEVRMRAPSLTLERVTHRLPEGRWLFSDIDLHLDLRRTGLIGRNGVGRACWRASLPALAPRRVLPSTWPRASRAAAGELRRDGGRLGRHRRKLAALERIEAGACDAADFACLGERWDLRGNWPAACVNRACPIGRRSIRRHCSTAARRCAWLWPAHGCPARIS